MNLNSVCLIGRLGKEPELKYTPSGSAVCSFSIAVEDMPKDGQKVSHWFRCVCWGKTAEFLVNYAGKGARVAVNGRLSTRSWEKDGAPVTVTEVICNNLELIDWKENDDAT